MPSAVLACPPLELLQLSEESGLWPMDLADELIRQANDNDTSTTLSMVSKAAAMPRSTWRVRIEGKAQVRGSMQHCLIVCTCSSFVLDELP